MLKIYKKYIMLQNIQKKKHPLLKPDFRIRTHAQSDFIRSKT